MEISKLPKPRRPAARAPARAPEKTTYGPITVYDSWEEWIEAQRERIFRENAEERERKYAGLDVHAREEVAIAAEKANRKGPAK